MRWVWRAVALLLFAVAACRTKQPPVAAPAARSVETIRREGNGLLGSASAYLREHAHDPVDWQPWSVATLERAISSNRPIFVSIGYSSCHWCHVMHDEVFSSDDVGQVLNDNFVAIKVDREERPDIDAVYLAALGALAGSAGWPANLVLTPQREAYAGATYLPRARFLAFVRDAAERHRNDAGGLILPREPRSDLRGTALDADELRGMAANDDLDRPRDGPKFPMATRLTFLLHAVRKWPLPEVEASLRTTLDEMADGALRDPVSGGFHRYTVDRAWTTPHFEMMLYDNAMLASLYLEASVVFEEPRYRAIGLGTLDFLARDMRVPSGAFAASFDADTQGVEGAAWRWSEREIIGAVGEADGTSVAPLLRVRGEKVAPRWARRLESEANLAAWKRARPLLSAARKGIARRDDKVVAAWNGLAIEAFSRGFLLTGDPHYLDVAREAATATYRELHEARGMLLRTPAGPTAFAVDYGDLSGAYLAVFEATSDPQFLLQADALLGEVLPRKAPDGGFFDGSAELGESVSLEDDPEPSATGAVLRALVRRETLSPSPARRAIIDATRRAFGNGLRRQKLRSSAWLDALLLDAGPTYAVVIAGDDGALTKPAERLLAPWAFVVRVPERGADGDLLRAIPELQGKAGRPKAFVCERAACKAPTADPRMLRTAVSDGYRR